jgi:hypothetical protein
LHENPTLKNSSSFFLNGYYLFELNPSSLPVKEGKERKGREAGGGTVGDGFTRYRTGTSPVLVTGCRQSFIHSTGYSGES